MDHNVPIYLTYASRGK